MDTAAVNIKTPCHPDEQKDILILISMVLAWGGATNKFTNEGKLGYAHTAMNFQSICHPDEQKDILILISMDASGWQSHKKI